MRRSGSRRAGWLLVLVATMAVQATGARAAVTPRYPLAVASGGRTLIDQNGQPFLLWGDSAWSLIAQLNLSDAKRYLDDRQGRGFNTVLASLIERRFAANAPANRDGVPPFTGRAFATPNLPYFAAADQVISAAAARNIQVMLAPLYLGYQCGAEGWCAEVMNATAAELRSWGQFVGQRYASYDNILWVVGGDTDPTPVADKVRAFVAGLREFDTRHLMTAHNQRGTQAVTPWPSESWLTVNDIYTGTSTQYLDALAAYQRTPLLPFLLIEGTYEHGTVVATQALRAQAYWTVLSGGMGHMFGSCPIWDLGFSNSLCTDTDWVAGLASAGAVSMGHAQRLLASRPWQTLIPDTGHTTVTSGYGTSGDTGYATVGRASDGATVIAYLPTPRAITVNLTRVSGSTAAAWWYDPATGTPTSIGTFATTGSRTFTPSAPGDVVFVLDDASRGFAAPGTLTATAVPAASWLHVSAAAFALVALGSAVLRRLARR